MNISMELLKPVTGALKKYKSLAPSVIITVVALLLVLLTLSKRGDINEGMTKSTRSAAAIRSLRNNIPSKYESPQVQRSMDKLEEEANEIEKLATQSSQRDLITYEYKLFPEPEDQSMQIYSGFGKQYRTAIEKLIEAMKALDAPSEAEIRAKTGGGRTTAGFGGRGGDRAVAAQDPRIDALCLRRAQEVSVYANPSAFAWYPFWESYEFTGKTQAIEDCWDSQTAFWVYEDIADAIEKMNGDTGNVLSAPVKRLLGVRFTGPVTVGQRSTRGYGHAMGTAGVRDKPNYVTPLLPSMFLSYSPTGRLGNDDVDIVHFAVSVLLDNRSILPFMKELCNEKPHSFYPDFVQSAQPVESRHNQITILQSDLKVIDKTDPAHELYRYGKGAVVRLDLVCEYQFYRAGYDAIKPKAIKKRLGQPESEGTGEQGDPQNNAPGGMMPPMF
jgi:hypothetical protein